MMRPQGLLVRMCGCERRGDSDVNETIHKETKSAYYGTNHQTSMIAKKVFTVRNTAEE